MGSRHGALYSRRLSILRDCLLNVQVYASEVDSMWEYGQTNGRGERFEERRSCLTEREHARSYFFVDTQILLIVQPSVEGNVPYMSDEVGLDNPSGVTGRPEVYVGGCDGVCAGSYHSAKTNLPAWTLRIFTMFVARSPTW